MNSTRRGTTIRQNQCHRQNLSPRTSRPRTGAISLASGWLGACPPRSIDQQLASTGSHEAPLISARFAIPRPAGFDPALRSIVVSCVNPRVAVSFASASDTVPATASKRQPAPPGVRGEIGDESCTIKDVRCIAKNDMRCGYSMANADRPVDQREGSAGRSQKSA